MKTLMLIQLAMCLSVISFSQEVISSLDLEDSGHFNQVVSLGDHGAVVRTGNISAYDQRNPDWKITRISANGEIIYSHDIENLAMNTGFSNPMITSPNGDLVVQYHSQSVNAFKEKSKLFLHMFNKTGDYHQLEISNEGELGHLRMGWATETAFYVLSTEEASVHTSKDKEDLTFYLTMAKYGDANHKLQKLDLPLITEGKHSSIWAYAGQFDGGFFLQRKAIDDDTNEVTYFICKMSDEGELLNNIQIKPATGDQIFSSSRNQLSLPGSYWFDSTTHLGWDFRDSDFNRLSTPDGTRMVPLPGSKGDVFFHPETNSFYIHGLLSSVELGSKKKPGFYGCFLGRYGVDGSAEWEKISRIEEESLQPKGKFRLYPYRTAVGLNISESMLVEHVQKKDLCLALIYDQSGNEKEVRTYEDGNWYDPPNPLIDAELREKFYETMEKDDWKAYSVIYVWTSESLIVLKLHEKSKTLDILRVQ